MKHFSWLAAWLFFLIAAPAGFAQTNAPEKLAGRWLGDGMGIQTGIVIDKDRTWRTDDNSDDGTWRVIARGIVFTSRKGKEFTVALRNEDQILLSSGGKEKKVATFQRDKKYVAPVPAPLSEAEKKNEQKIVGKWEGLGYGAGMIIEFKADHAYQSDGMAGTWSYKEGKFKYVVDEGYWIATINDEDELVCSEPEDEKEAGSKANEPPAETSMIYRRYPDPKTAATKTAAATLPLPSTGEWRFASIKKSNFNGAPPFDGLTFLDKDKVRISFSAMKKQYDVDYVVSPGYLRIPWKGPEFYTKLMQYMPMGGGYAPLVVLTYHYENDGKSLVIGNMQAAPTFKCEWVFLRPEQFLKEGISGKWRPQDERDGVALEFLPDGTCKMSSGRETKPPLLPAGAPPQPVPFYRLWNSPYGPAISILSMDGEMQLIAAQMATYTIKDNELTMTMIELDYGEKMKLHPEQKRIFKQVKE